MPRLIHATPRYRKHRASGQAVVSIQGRDHYLGPWKSKASLVEYDRLIAEWLANGRQLSVAANDRDSVTVAEVLARYWPFAKQHYRKDGKATSSLDGIKRALQPLRRLYGHTRAVEFGSVALKAIRQTMIDAGWSRGTINKRVGAIKRMFAWAVAEELVPPSVHHGLSAVKGLQRGRTDAPDHEDVTPVREGDIQATLHHLPEIIADMVRLQRLAGCRPGEVWVSSAPAT